MTCVLIRVTGVVVNLCIGKEWPCKHPTGIVPAGAEIQHQVFDSTVRALKWLPPLLQGEAKDLVSVKKILAGEGYWECIKEVLGWIVDTEAGTVSLP